VYTTKNLYFDKMSVSRDVINIPLKTLSDFSRKVFRFDVFKYQLYLLFMRGPESYDELMSTIKIDLKDDIIRIEGPAYGSGLEGFFTANWKVLFENYLLEPGFIDALCQLRIVTVNPLSVYYQLLSNEARIYGKERKPEGMKMRRAAVELPQIQDLLIRDLPSAEDPKLEPVVKRKVPKSYEFSRSSYGDGHVVVERYEEDVAGGGGKVGMVAEGFVDELLPPDMKIDPLRDHPNGLLINLFPGYPFYAFNYKNIYPKIHDINRMIESGQCVVFVDRVDNRPLVVIEEEYRLFFRDWGIPVVDFVTSERMAMAELPSLVQPPENAVSGIRYTNLPNFFVIQRPIEKFHSMAWCGINSERRRGLTGIPWAKDEYSGMDIADPQPDDGFLSYFVAEGVKRRLQGKLTNQLFFPLCTILTPGEIGKIIRSVEKGLNRAIRYNIYREEGVVGVFLRSMGEWVILRAVLRKHL
jgi:hypothetical protein